jgi:hypothetical protein
MTETAAPARRTDFMEIFFSAMRFDYPHLPEPETVSGARFPKTMLRSMLRSGECAGRPGSEAVTDALISPHHRSRISRSPGAV